MNPTERTARHAELQSTLRTHPRLKLELLASISRLFREHGVDLPPEVLAHLTLSLEGVQHSADEPPPPVPPPPGPGIMLGDGADGHLVAFDEAGA